MTRFRTREDVRRALERRHGKLPEEVWRALVDMDIADVALGNEGDFNYVEEQLAQILAVYRAGQDRRPRRRGSQAEEETLPADERLLALCEILAIAAARRPDVQRFRKEVLGGRLIPREEIPAWVKARLQEDGPASMLVTVTVAVAPEALPPAGLPLPEQAAAAQRAAAAGQVVRFGHQWLVLTYPENGAAQSVFIAHGGTLWHLKQLAERLERDYGWQEPQAVAFVLSGTVPLLTRGKVRLEWKTGRPRIILDLDPRLSRTEVARLYGKWRSRVFQGADKPIERKARRLAVFAEEHREDGRTWRELMALWNEQHPEWAYSVPAHFAREVVLAWERVTGAKWTPKKGGRSRGKEGAR